MTSNRFLTSKKQLAKGFTLIELMVAVVILGVLAAIAYPNYIQHTTKSRRSAAEAFMLSIANREEQILLDRRSYVDVPIQANLQNSPNAAPPGLNLSVPTDVSRYYNITVVAPAVAGAPPTYTITATPTGAQLTNDTRCPSISLNQAGVKLPASGCW